MDPFSITTGVLALVGNAIKLLNIVHEYSSEFQRAELNIRLLSTECEALQLALIEIDRLCKKNDEANTAGSSMRLVLGDCQEQLKMLVEMLQPFVQYLGTSSSNRMGIRARISTTLNRQEIESYRQSIQRQGQLVNLLLTVLQHQSILKIREILEGLEFQDLLQKSHEDTKSLRTASEKSKSSFYAGPRSTRNSGVNAGPEADSIIGDEEFPFDEELINTLAYRRAFKAVQKKRANLDQPQSPPSTDSSITPTSSNTRTGFSKFFRKAMKIGDPGDPSSSSTKPTATATATTGPGIVEPINEMIVEDSSAGSFTDQTVRDAKAKFHELMTLHSEVLALKFADTTYSGVLETKIKERAKAMSQLQDFVVSWKLSCENKAASGVTTVELENLEWATTALASLGEEMEL